MNIEESSKFGLRFLEIFPESLKRIVQENDLDLLKRISSRDEDERFECLCSPKGNIFHFAVYENNVEFMKEAIRILPALCCEQTEARKWNPLHVAAWLGHRKIVKVILDYYRSQLANGDDVIQKPWLALDYQKNTPLLCAILCRYEGVALDILSMDVELLANIPNLKGLTPIFMAIGFQFNRVAIQILTCAPNCTLSIGEHETVLFLAAQSTEEICKMLIDRAPELIIGYSERFGNTVLHMWVEAGNLYPLEYVLNKNEIITPDLRRGFIEQLGMKERKKGYNPLHCVLHSIQDDAFSVKIAEILVNAYKQEMSHLFSSPEFEPPWLMDDAHGLTPLHKAIVHQSEKLAIYLFSLDSLKFLEKSASRCALEDDTDYYDVKYCVNLMLLAIKHKCPKVAEAILSTMQENQNNTSLLQLLTYPDGRNALSFAPLGTVSLLKQLLETYPKFITQLDDNGNSLLHYWTYMGNVWAIRYMIKTKDINPQSKSSFIDLSTVPNAKNRIPLHLAAASKKSKEMVDIVKHFLDVSLIKFQFSKLRSQRDSEGNTPLEIAISNRCEELALLFLSIDDELEDVGKDIMFIAIDNNCHKLVKFLLEWSIAQNDQTFLKSTDVGNVLHVAWKTTEKNARLMVENWPYLINENDSSEKKPLERASEAGKAWLVKGILQKDRSSMEKTPLAWVDACRNGHVSTVLAFVDNSPYFRSICHKEKNSPLHHIQNATYKGYKQLLEHKFINEGKNAQNKEGETPLHVAIETNNKDLAEILLTTDGVDWNIKDKRNKKAKHLLREKCQDDAEWKNMCNLIGIDPMLKANYIEVRTNLMDMRGTISVVATLLATITITAGFAVPGGFDSNGNAVLSRTATFWVFVLSNTYAMCCAILILFWNTWSMVSNKDKASTLVDRSVWLLKQSLYGMLVAFTVAMYIVIHKKSLWAAIVVAVMVALVIVLAQRKVLYKILKLLKYIEDHPVQFRRLISTSTEREIMLSPYHAHDIENQAIEETMALFSENQVRSDTNS